MIQNSMFTKMYHIQTARQQCFILLGFDEVLMYIEFSV
jgi:hypothetical protein